MVETVIVLNEYELPSYFIFHVNKYGAFEIYGDV